MFVSVVVSSFTGPENQNGVSVIGVCLLMSIFLPFQGVKLILCFFVLSAHHDFPNIYWYMFTVSLIDVFPPLSRVSPP